MRHQKHENLEGRDRDFGIVVFEALQQVGEERDHGDFLVGRVIRRLALLLAVGEQRMQVADALQPLLDLCCGINSCFFCVKLQADSSHEASKTTRAQRKSKVPLSIGACATGA